MVDKKRRGMTLIEVLFATALTAIVISAGVTSLVAGMTLHSRTSARSAQYINMEATLDAIMERARVNPSSVRVDGGVLYADGVAFKNAGGHVIVDKDVWIEFAALTCERDGDILRVTITADAWFSISRTWTLRLMER